MLGHLMHLLIRLEATSKYIYVLRQRMLEVMHFLQNYTYVYIGEVNM